MEETRKMMTMTVFCDTTDLYTEEEIEHENLCDLEFPFDIVYQYYNEFFHHDYLSWRDFLDNYTADDTDTLYDYAKDHGFEAKRAA